MSSNLFLVIVLTKDPKIEPIYSFNKEEVYCIFYFPRLNPPLSLDSIIKTEPVRFLPYGYPVSSSLKVIQRRH